MSGDYQSFGLSWAGSVRPVGLSSSSWYWNSSMMNIPSETKTREWPCSAICNDEGGGDIVPVSGHEISTIGPDRTTISCAANP